MAVPQALQLADYLAGGVEMSSPSIEVTGLGSLPLALAIGLGTYGYNKYNKDMERLAEEAYYNNRNADRMIRTIGVTPRRGIYQAPSFFPSGHPGSPSNPIQLGDVFSIGYYDAEETPAVPGDTISIREQPQDSTTVGNSNPQIEDTQEDNPDDKEPEDKDSNDKKPEDNDGSEEGWVSKGFHKLFGRKASKPTAGRPTPKTKVGRAVKTLDEEIKATIGPKTWKAIKLELLLGSGALGFLGNKIAKDIRGTIDSTTQGWTGSSPGDALKQNSDTIKVENVGQSIDDNGLVINPANNTVDSLDSQEFLKRLEMARKAMDDVQKP